MCQPPGAGDRVPKSCPQGMREVDNKHIDTMSEMNSCYENNKTGKRDRGCWREKMHVG